MTAKSERIGTSASWLNAALVLAAAAGVFAQFWSNTAQGADSKSADQQEDVFMIRNSADNSVRRVPKSKFPLAFECSLVRGGGLAFNIMKGDPIKGSPGYDALIIFPDEPGRRGLLFKQGLDWNFSWGSNKKRDRKYSIIITPGGRGYYYDWSLADKHGKMKVDQTLICTK